MKTHVKKNFIYYVQVLFSTIYFSASCIQAEEPIKDIKVLEEIRLNRDHPEILAELLPIVKCSFIPTQYEQILMTQLRDKQTSMKKFREISKKITSLLVFKVTETIPVVPMEIETPLIKYEGITFAGTVDFVSVMRSGDALLETFIEHFPNASISKILVQRDEATAEPEFKYMKLSPSLNKNSHVVITEPMIATGGTLSVVIVLLKEKGVLEENITIASICTAPEGLIVLNNKFPKINVVMTVMDDHLDESKYIVPGLGDFGDRFFGTVR
ncbi:MAG TPA: uracil phosphoribosyltransferase [Parachlamydiaceae bacterium]|nr:uracil phosphoribosyltransferase [Parachlamydiaceae bacterium]